MATYTWDGSSFGTSLESQFLIDINGNYYFYEKNYNSFFKVVDPTTTGNAPTYVVGQSANFNLNPGTTLIALDQYAPEVIPFDAALLLDRQSGWINDGKNILNDFTQNPSALVASLINTSGLNGTVFDKLENLAPTLVDKGVNFAFQEILNKWPNGQDTVASINNILLGLQLQANGALQSNKTVSDFKKKLIRQSTQIADATSKLQQQADKILSGNTLTALASAIPGMSNITSLVTNAESKYGTELAALLPSTGLGGTSVEGIISSLFGGKIPAITSAIDKIAIDINDLEGGFNELVASFPTNGFHSLADLTSVCNQSVNLLNNLLGDLPLKNTVQIPNPVTDATQIFNSLVDTYKNQLGILSNSSMAALTAITTVTQSLSATVLSVIPSLEPFAGGSFSNTPSLSGILSDKDPSVTPPNITASPDPTVAAKQVANAGQQVALDAQGKPVNTKRGQCINSLEEFPLRPRNTTLDGSPGTYNVSAKIDY